MKTKVQRTGGFGDMWRIIGGVLDELLYLHSFISEPGSSEFLYLFPLWQQFLVWHKLQMNCSKHFLFTLSIFLHLTRTSRERDC